MWPYFCAAGLFERGRPEQAVQEGHAAQNVLLGTEKNILASFISLFSNQSIKSMFFSVFLLFPV